MTDNVYYKQAPQAYVPYAPAGGVRNYGSPRVAADEAMLPMAIVGLCCTLFFGLPVGLFTGPAALRRASRVERLVDLGDRPLSDRGNVTGVRVCAWISIGLSIPLLLMWLGVITLIAIAIAG